MQRITVILLLSATSVVGKITKDFVKKQFFGLLWSIFVMASVVFAIFIFFALLDALVEIFLVSE